MSNDPVEQRALPVEERWFQTIYEMINLFWTIDANEDGQLSVEEVRTGLFDLLPAGSSLHNLPEPVMDQIDSFLEDFDSNKDGFISLKGKRIFRIQ